MKTKFENRGYEMLKKTAGNDVRSSSCIYVPKKWAGKKVVVIRVE